jgi:hypothetical protein
MVAELFKFCAFTLNQGCKTCMETLLSQSGRNWQLTDLNWQQKVEKVAADFVHLQNITK